jgi:hypothetical protein
LIFDFEGRAGIGDFLEELRGKQRKLYGRIS